MGEILFCQLLIHFPTSNTCGISTVRPAAMKYVQKGFLPICPELAFVLSVSLVYTTKVN